MVQEINGNYVRRTSSGVMKCGSSLSFGSKARNAIRTGMDIGQPVLSISGEEDI